MGTALSPPPSTAGSTPYDHLSLWHATAGEPLAPRPALVGPVTADVVIVGAGFTGLWTAYYLLMAEPSLSVVVVEAETSGFGASGRNGGWCSALFPLAPTAMARRYGAEAAQQMHAALSATIDEIERVTVAEGIDAHLARGGSIVAARTPAQLVRASAQVAEHREVGLPAEDLLLLDAHATTEHIMARGTLGGTYTPRCARIHPARLVRGLARAVERRGGLIHERTRAVQVDPHRVITEGGRVDARFVVIATEAFTPTLPRRRRALAPVYSLMIATDPLPPTVWANVGLPSAETFSDHRHVIVYGQRTADDRLVFGGRGAPYHFGSRVHSSYDRVPGVFSALRNSLVDLFPDVAGHVVTHEWGGPLGIPRDWMPSVGCDQATGLAWAGGYVGDGVSTTNLAGRTLADLLTGQDSPLTHLPWVGHRSPRWELEPLRYVGVNAGLTLARAADVEERLTGRPARLGIPLARLTGG